MKQAFLYLFLISCFFQSACKDQVVENQATCRKYVELNYSNYNSLRTDQVSLISATVDGDCLMLTLQYSGGCEDHQIDLALIQPECGTLPLPPPTFEIRHNANNDVCKALVTKKYSFDVSGIRESGKSKTDFVLNTRNASGIMSTNTYTYSY